MWFHKHKKAAVYCIHEIFNKINMAPRKQDHFGDDFQLFFSKISPIFVPCDHLTWNFVRSLRPRLFVIFNERAFFFRGAIFS